VSSLTAALGLVDARPVGGKFSIKVGPAAISEANTTAPLEWDASLDTDKVAAALNALATEGTYGTARVVESRGSWLIFFGEQTAQVPLTVVRNGLWPVSVGRVKAWQVDGRWVHELRLTQAPVALTSGVEATLPPEPEITRVQAGGSVPGYEWNEIQQLYIPPEFRGSFVIKKGTAKTSQLSIEDGIDAILEALQALGAGNFKVTLPLSNKPLIEFIGDYSGQEMDLLVAQVVQAPLGDATFTLPLDRAELAAILRGRPAVTLPLEIRINGEDEAGFETEVCALSLPMTVRQPVVWPDLEGVPMIDLLRPYSPKTYVPYGAGNSLTAGRAYQETVGDDEATEFVLAHGLDSEAVMVFVRENVSGGRLLVNGTDYEATIDNANQVTVTALVAAPATDGWRIVVLSALAVAQWATDLTVTVPQVVAGSGYPALPDFMDDLSDRVSTVEGLLGVAGAGAATVATPASPIGLIPLAEALPAKLGTRLPALPRAIRDTSVGMISGEELAEPTQALAGSVLAWDATSEVYLTEGSQHRRGYVATTADAPAVLCDGYNWWLAADKDGAAAGPTFWPTEMDRTLWEVAVTPELLAPGRKLSVTWSVLLALLAERPELRGVYTLRVRKGTMTSEASMTGNNVQAIAWDQSGGAEELLFEQRLNLTRSAVVHPFALQIARAEGGALSATRTAYGKTLSAPAPQNTQFVLRAELVRFDLENYAAPMGLPLGQVLVACGKAEASKDLLSTFNFGEEEPALILAATIN
jgi:hypothetical protein